MNFVYRFNLVRNTVLVLGLLFVLAACSDNDQTGGMTGKQDSIGGESASESGSEKSEKILSDDDRSSELRALTGNWKTNWQKHSIPYSELLSGGPPRDGIPSIDAPRFAGADQAKVWLADNEPVIALNLQGHARAYPLQILIWHEIVNDTVATVPVLVTFCPLCNSAIVFDRRLDGKVYDFGTSGLLRNSDLVMYDRTTESLWQQFTGKAIAGDLTGSQLAFLPSSVVSFADFRKAYPGGAVLSRETGFSRNYGHNPYAGYDNIDEKPFLFTGTVDGRLSAMERVVTVSLGKVNVAYPYNVLSRQGVINDTRDGKDLAVFYTKGTNSALDAPIISKAKDVGAANVFDPRLEERKLTFRRDGNVIVDEQTGSTWTILGQATNGPLAGKQLTPIVHGDHFWFSWAAFKPDTFIYKE